ncbi:ATP-binding protein [Methylocella sp. CPCC 101449]|uniref:ATP-binding protein n=1 Tax=Methylocella sp. CPCC 101449 TaxID=2987531 RepID=UPI00289206B0|nr:ATP-binding protein [Methylocella sp. CPCC 101449]MDT2022831.1 ATP-binding protein [Methylocella sp. CPCC 101449]
MTIEKVTAHAYPTKAFFVRMITRDISLEDCVLDLIDNSIDSAWSREGSHPMMLTDNTNLSGYKISIEASSERFVIRDNCGGMSLDTAADHAFSFGRNATADQEHYSIGVYGIGMKRAVFKLGANIKVRSTFKETNGNRLAFAVPIDVNQWLENNDPPWDFDIIEDDRLEEDGVEISVTELSASSESSLSSPAFLQNLRRTIARDYSLHLQRGLKISLNGEWISGWAIELRQSDEYQPMRELYEDEVNGDAVSIEIIGGMAAPPPEDIEPDESNEGDRRFGWYVVCNGRIVLAADKSSITGWGTDDWPQWHYQYAGFIGIILFTAANAAALPLTTTKRSVDTSSEVFRRARPKMRQVSKEWIAYTNQRKQALQEAKQKESEAVAVPIASVAARKSVNLPTFQTRTSEKMANIGYSVSAQRLRKLAQEFGNINMTYRDVGLKSFDYAYDDLVGVE